MTSPIELDGLVERLKYWRSQALKAEQALEEARGALEPFAKAGLLIDRYFPDNGDADPYHGGAAWSEEGRTRAVTLGDFRRASSVHEKLKDQADGA